MLFVRGSGAGHIPNRVVLQGTKSEIETDKERERHREKERKRERERDR